MQIAEFVDSVYLAYVRENLRAATVHGYEKLWTKVLVTLLTGKELREFRTVDAANVLTTLANRGLNTNSLKHAKSVLSGIFTYAKNVGALDGTNPVTDAIIPRKAKRPLESHATSTDDVYQRRRGIATLVTSIAHDKGMAAKGLLRHSSLATTQTHYIKEVPKDTT